MDSPGSVYLLYHFFHPDDVVSGRLFSDLAEDLTDAGFDVTALPSVRSCHGADVRLKQKQSWAGGKIRRVWRPDWPQHKTWGRFGNAMCMLIGWTWRAAVMPRRRKEVMIVGTDPVLGVLIAITWRLLRPKAKIVHWCHDVYPHAAIADGMIRDDAYWVRLINFMLRIAYRRCDLIVDLGVCMRRLLQQASGDAADSGFALTGEPPARGQCAENGDTTRRNEIAAGFDSAARANSSTALVTDRDARRVIADLATSISEDCAADRSLIGWDAQAAAEQLSMTLGDDSRDDVSATDGGAEVWVKVAAASQRSGASDSSWRSGRYATLVPWSLVEPAELPEVDPFVRAELFGDSNLGLLYSGNFGRGHCFESVLDLARRLRPDDVGFCFAGRGLRLDPLRESVTAQDTNIRFAGFADENQLEARLASADIHLVSLRPSWTGAVVPSKFFGALASGRPVLFAGSPDSAIALWIKEFGIGWVLTERTIDQVAAQLKWFAEDVDDQQAMRQRCFSVYRREFSRRVQIDRWLQVLTGQDSQLWGDRTARDDDPADEFGSLASAADDSGSMAIASDGVLSQSAASE
jgi:glycosyltransferase involved in cell wall biosynthesis